MRKIGSDPSFSVLEIERRGAAGFVWLNRPEQRNAMNDAMLVELPKAFEQLRKDPAVRVVVLGGRGPAFCAGADLARMDKAGRTSPVRNRAQAHTRRDHVAVHAVMEQAEQDVQARDFLQQLALGGDVERVGIQLNVGDGAQPLDRAGGDGLSDENPGAHRY